MKKTKKVSRKPAAKKSAKKSSRPKAARKASPARRTAVAKKPPARAAEFPSTLALYVYGITQIPDEPLTATSEGVDGHHAVEPIADGDFICWVSRVPRQEFAIDLQKHMEDLEWLAACSIRHQKVLAEVGAVTQVLPARFGTIFLTPDSLVADLRAKAPHLGQVFRRIAQADEWGVKIFGAAQSQTNAAVTAASGSDYLRKKSEAIHASPRKDEALQRFGEELSAVSEASVPGGKASASQPGLLWSGSFLVKRAHKSRFDTILKRYASEWGSSRRIDVSGPWPPYSFVSENQ